MRTVLKFSAQCTTLHCFTAGHNSSYVTRGCKEETAAEIVIEHIS